MSKLHSTIVVLADEYTDYQKKLVNAIAKENQRNGYATLCVTGCEIDEYAISQKSLTLGNRLYPQWPCNRVQGLISLSGTIGSNVDIDRLNQFVNQFSMPKVSIGIPITGIANVLVDDCEGMSCLMQHLIADTDAKNFVFIRGFENDPYSNEREGIFRKVLANANYKVNESFFIRGNYDLFESFQVVHKLLESSGGDIDAIVAANDAMALSAARAITAQGYTIPNDIIVTGFDDTGEASRHSPALTTVRQPLAEMAKKSVDLLIQQIDNNKLHNSEQAQITTEYVQSELVVRGSSIVNTGSLIEANVDINKTKLFEDISVSMSGLMTPTNVDLRKITDGLYRTLTSGGDDLASILDTSLTDGIALEQQHWWSNLCHQIESYSQQLFNCDSRRQHLPVTLAALFPIKERTWALTMEQSFEERRLQNFYTGMQLRMSSCANQSDILATTTSWLNDINPERWYLVRYEAPSTSPHQRAKLLQVFKDERAQKLTDSGFVSVDLLPPSLTDDFNTGLLVLKPIFAGDTHFGYLLLDPSGIESIDIASISISIGNAMRNRYLQNQLETQAGSLRQANSELAQLANFDSLTGLPNRFQFHQKMEQFFDNGSSQGTTLVVLFVDLDGFKTVNDTMGHEAGDHLLKTIAQRLSDKIEVANVDGLVSRLGGDEFTVLANINSENIDGTITELANEILKKIRIPCPIGDQVAMVSASIGYSTMTSETANVDSLLSQADSAMYQAKASGKDAVVAFTPSHEDARRQQTEIHQELRKAISNDELIMYYQPRIDLSTGKICGAESLMRWIRKAADRIEFVAPPDQFIAAAEKVGLIRELDSIALEQCLKQIKAWQVAGLEITTSVNVSVMSLQQSNIAEEIISAIEKHAIDPSLLELEITETAAMTDVERNISTLNTLRKAGVKLSIDDFGTGYSSLTYLKQLPVDNLKIDRSFVMDIDDTNCGDGTHTAIIRAVVALGKSLDISLVAEGVETEHQHRFVSSLGCNEAQGFYFYTPMPAMELTQLLQNYCEGQKAA